MNNASICMSMISHGISLLRKSGVTQLPPAFMRGFFVSHDGIEVQYRSRIVRGRLQVVLIESKGFASEYSVHDVPDDIDEELKLMMSRIVDAHRVPTHMLKGENNG